MNYKTQLKLENTSKMHKKIVDLPKQWCLKITFHDNIKTPDDELFRLYDKDSIFLNISKTSKNLLLLIYTNHKSTPLELEIPDKLMPNNDTHTILLCYHGHRISLYYNDELVDEEWSIGIFGNELMFVDIDINIMSASISNDFNKEKKIIECQSQETYLQLIQYWKPSGYNTRVGDCMPFYKDGCFHLFYLLDRHGHKSKWGLGAHEWFHISTKDLISWDIHKKSIEITNQWEGSICTGSVIFFNDIYYAFYAVRMSDLSPTPLTYSTSTDGINFIKSNKNIMLSSPYEPTSARDPMVFQDDDGLFHMLVTTELTNPKTPNKGGCLAHLVSNDLHDWVQLEPFIVPGYSDQPECCDYFKMNGWYYLIFSNYGVAKYRMSKKPFGPWIKPTVDIIDGYQYRVPKTAMFNDNRRLIVGFLAQVPNEYAGNTIFREIISNEDGTLSTKFLDEVMPKSVAWLNEGIKGSITLGNKNGYEYTKLTTIPKDCIIAFKATPSNDSMYYGIQFNSIDNSDNDYELLFDIARAKVGLRRSKDAFIKENEDKALYNVAQLDKETTIKILIKDDIIDICINNERTMVLRNPVALGGSIAGFYVMGGDISLKGIKIENI